jgi:hypothetical protein
MNAAMKLQTRRWNPEPLATSSVPVLASAFLLLLLFTPAIAGAHDISAANRQALEAMSGPQPVPYLYLGAKHMVTGIDHVLFLAGVVFFLHRLRDIVLYVSMFTIGHSLTLIGGVLAGLGINAYLVDAIIGLSVVYKGYENIGGFRRLGLAFDTRAAVLVFGLFHGLGLASRMMDLAVSSDGLLVNLISFNIGVEIGQVLVLAVIVVLLNAWRRKRSFGASAFYVNIALMAAGFILVGQQLAGYFAS